MPSTSKKQHNFMEAIAHNKAFAKKVGVPQSVGKDFAAADKGKHFRKGGTSMTTKKRSVNPAMAMMAARAMPTPAAAPMAPPPGPMAAPGGMPGMKKGGISHKGKEMKKMAKGGETMGPRTMKDDAEKGSNKMAKFGESKVQKRGHTEDRKETMKGNTIGTQAPKKMAKGGSTSSRADGIAQRGRTNTKYC